MYLKWKLLSGVNSSLITPTTFYETTCYKSGSATNSYQIFQARKQSFSGIYCAKNIKSHANRAPHKYFLHTSPGWRFHAILVIFRVPYINRKNQILNRTVLLSIYIYLTYGSFPRTLGLYNKCKKLKLLKPSQIMQFKLFLRLKSPNPIGYFSLS